MKSHFIRLLLGCLLTLTGNTLLAQPQTALLFFIDKHGTSGSLQNPSGLLTERALDRRARQGIGLQSHDLPVSEVYLSALSSLGAEILGTSRWLNAALVRAEAEQLQAFAQLSIVKSTAIPLGTLSPMQHSECTAWEVLAPHKTQDEFYGFSANQLNMLGIIQMQEEGFRGEGIRIAIFDSGFLNAPALPAFDSLFLQNRVIETYDFVDRETAVFEDHRHGLQVLSVLAAYLPGELIGAAWKAEYLLYRTEDVASETRIEEFYWLQAAERADSLGADIINSSLGYNLFDDEADDYTLSQLDGQTALISIAAQFAARTGMLVVTSAGNEGRNSWGSITFPADVDSILSVGAINNAGLPAPFSSLGPTADGRRKPDVVAVGSGTSLLNSSGQVTTSSGTSFSAPLISGLAAGIWQANPHLHVAELIETIRSSGNLASRPDNQLGYGIPSFSRAVGLVTAVGPEIAEVFEVYPNPIKRGQSLKIALPGTMHEKPIALSIFNTTGSLVKQIQQPRLGDGSLMPEQLFSSSGLYLLAIQVGNSRQVFRILYQD